MTPLSGRDLVRLLERRGWVVTSQRGSHIKLKPPDGGRPVIVPDHKTLRTGTQRAILRQAGVSTKDL